MKRLSQREALLVFKVKQREFLSPPEYQHLTKRGLAVWEAGHLVLTQEAEKAFRQWSGT